MDIPNTYLFKAYYDDGEEYLQDEADTSIQPDGINAFYDVWYKPVKPKESLFAFRLTEIANDPQTFAVNLHTGQFEINDFVFYQHGHDEKLLDFQLLYYRVPAVHQHIQGNGKTTESHSLGYMLGFQAAKPDGEKVVKFIRI